MNNEISAAIAQTVPTQAAPEPVVETVSKGAKPLELSHAIDVRQLLASPDNINEISLGNDVFASDFKFGEPCPLKLADGIFLKDGDTVTRVDTITFSPSIVNGSSYIQRRVENAQTAEARIDALCEYLAAFVTHVGDVPIADAAKFARTRDNKPKSIFADMTLSDVIITQIGARISVNPDRAFDYAIAMNDCECPRRQRVYDVAELDPVTLEDVSVLNSIKELKIRYCAKVQELTELPLYGVRLPRPFEIVESEETIDELYFRPMLLREFAAYFSASNNGKKGFKDIELATQLKMRVAAMPQSQLFGSKRPGEIFNPRFYDNLSNHQPSVNVVQQVLMNLSAGTYNGVNQDLRIGKDSGNEIKCPKCPGIDVRNIKPSINWIDPHDFIYVSPYGRPVPSDY